MLDALPWRVWRIRLLLLLSRLRSAVALAAVVAAAWGLEGLTSAILDPVRGDFRSSEPVRHEASDALDSGWVAAREGLNRAHQLRRDGETAAAIRGYARVIRTTTARTSDVQTARAWRARLCLSSGESSALDDLMELVAEHLSPQLYVHIATTAMEGATTTSGDDIDLMRRALIDASVRQLERSSRVRGGSGERARGWLDRLRTKSATFFSS